MRHFFVSIVSSALLAACAGPNAQSSPRAAEPAASSTAGELHADDSGDSDHPAEPAQSLESDGCEPANLGAKPADVIWCLHHVETKAGTVSYSRALYVARLKKLVKLVDIPYAVGPMDSDEPKTKDSDRYLVKLAFERAADGKHVSVQEAPGLDCAHADQQNEDNKNAAPVLYKAYLPAIKQVCAQRGNWEWTGATLVRRGR
jgi:hypothetical protein